jgi:hypothetical protein
MVRSFVTRRDTQLVEIRNGAGDVRSHNYVFFGEAARRQGMGPQAFMAETPAGTAGHPHFHNVDQYQIFYPAPGATYKNKPIDSPLLHYTDAFTAYGPYASGPELPSEHLTLRARHSSVTAYVPEEREKLAGVRYVRRHFTVPLGVPRRLHVGQASVDVLIEPEDDGLAAYLLESGPNTQAALPPLGAVSGGQYCCLLDGSVREGEVDLPAEAVRWDDPGENAEAFMAGGSGMRLVVLRFPSPPTSERNASPEA